MMGEQGANVEAATEGTAVPTVRRSRLRRGAVGLAFLAGAVVASIVTSSVVLAGGSPFFTDVPPDHPFRDEISQLSSACIAGGYPDNTYRPDAPVTRQAMAAFLTRIASRPIDGVPVGATSPSFGHNVAGEWGPYVTVAEVTVVTPDLPGNCQIPVELHGVASAYINDTQANACFSPTVCNVEVWLTAGDSPISNAASFGRFNAGYAAFPLSAHTVTQQADNTSVTYRLKVRGFNVEPSKGLVSAQREIVAVHHPMRAWNAF